MLSRKKWIIGLVAILLVAAWFVSNRSRGCADALCAEPRAAAATYGAPGAHAVGSRVLLGGERSPLPMKIWYPAVAGDNSAGAAACPYEVKLGAPLGTVTIASSPSRAVPDAAIDVERGPYPLVVLSPGFAIGAASYGWLAEHLASYGFVVIAPEHRETLVPQNQLWQAAVRRPDDILTVFDFVDKQAEAGGTLEGLVDLEQTAVVGHSYGGYTALAAAGARINTDSFERHCAAAVQTQDPTAWLCDMLLPRLADMAGAVGLDGVPSGLWPQMADTRVDAIVPLAGDAYFFGQSGLAEISVPVLAVGGTLDADTPFMWGPQPTYEYTAGPKKALLALDGAEHMIFSATCESIRWYARPLAGEFCADSTWDRGRAHDLVRHFTTAFLLAELKHDADGAASLAPSAVEFPNVTYVAQGY